MDKQSKSYSLETVRLRTGRDPEELVRELYLARHSDREIAEAIGVSRTLVRQWRATWGIARSDRDPIVIEGAA